MRRAFFFIVALLSATSSFASLPRASMLDRASEHAPAVADLLPETRVWASDVLAPFERPAESELTRALHQAYADLSTTNASGLGRFLSVDPILGDPSEPQTWNRYAYVTNSPLVFTDPSGMQRFGGAGATGSWKDDATYPPFDCGSQEGIDCFTTIAPPKTPHWSPEQLRGMGEAAVARARDEFLDAAEAAVHAFESRASGRAAALNQLASRIGAGHAEKHIRRGQVPPGVTTVDEFTRAVASTLLNPTHLRPLPRNRVAFLDAQTGLVVIVNPNDKDGGSAYVPRNPTRYFLSLHLK